MMEERCRWSVGVGRPCSPRKAIRCQLNIFDAFFNMWCFELMNHSFPSPVRELAGAA